MNKQKQYVYVMQPTALAGAPMMVAYEVENLADKPSEFEIVRAKQHAEAAELNNTRVKSVKVLESFSQAVRRLNRQKLWRWRATA